MTAYVSYFALAEGLCQAKARCQVVGGTAYDFTLKGITTTERYRLSQEKVIFHNVALMQLKRSSHTVVIRNEDSLPLPFSVISTPQLVRIEPASGVITAHGTAALQVHSALCKRQQEERSWVVVAAALHTLSTGDVHCTTP